MAGCYLDQRQLAPQQYICATMVSSWREMLSGPAKPTECGPIMNPDALVCCHPPNYIRHIHTPIHTYYRLYYLWYNNIIIVGVQCGVLQAPSDGYIHVTGIHYGDTATYFCHQSYHLTGKADRSCLASGYWSGAAAECMSK